MKTGLTAIAIITSSLLVTGSNVIADDDWKFRLSPYIWFAGFEGEVGPLKGVPSSDVDISASDALSDTDSSFMLILDAKKGLNGIYTDIFYSDITSTEKIDAGTSTKVRSSTETTMITVAYAYSVLQDNAMNVDLMAGARWWQIDADIKIKSQVPELNLSGDNTESWFDPFIGVKGKFPITDSNFYISGGGGYGGFDINAKSFYDISANLGYRWTDKIDTVVGYRQFDLDYDQNDFKYDAKQSGWQIGLTWAF